MNQREKVLEYLKANPNSRPKDIAEALGANKGSMGVLLYELKKEGLIESPEHGKYRIRNMTVEKMASTPQQQEKTQVPLPDLRNPDIILAYKDAYGKEAFLDILNKIKRLIE